MPVFEDAFSGLKNDRKLTKEELIRAIRFMIAAEYEAVQLYIQLAESIDDELSIQVLKDIADEEKVHAGEFLKVLKHLAPDEEDFYQEGEKEVDELKLSSKQEALQLLADLTNKRVKIADLGDTAYSVSSLKEIEDDLVNNIKGIAEDKALPMTKSVLNQMLSASNLSSDEQKDLLNVIDKTSSHPSIKQFKLILKDITLDNRQIKNFHKLYDAAKDVTSWQGVLKGKFDQKIRNIFKQFIKDNKVRQEKGRDITELPLGVAGNSPLGEYELAIQMEEMAQRAVDESIIEILKNLKFLKNPSILLSAKVFPNILRQRGFNYYNKLKSLKRQEKGIKESIINKTMTPKEFSTEVLEDKETLEEFVEFMKKRYEKISKKIVMPIISLIAHKGYKNIKMTELFKEEENLFKEHGIKNYTELREVIVAIREGIEDFVDMKKDQYERAMAASNFATIDEAIQYLSDIVGVKIRIGSSTKLDSSTKSKINKDLDELNSPPYFKEIPLQDIFDILERHGVVALQEDNKKWGGMLIGEDASTIFDIAPLSSEEQKDYGIVYTPYDNVVLQLSWYKMPETGNYEIVAYVG